MCFYLTVLFDNVKCLMICEIVLYSTIATDTVETGDILNQ